MKIRLNYFVIFVVLWVIFLLITPDLSIGFFAFETWFFEILQDQSTITYYTYLAGVIVLVGVFHMFWTKNEK